MKSKLTLFLTSAFLLGVVACTKTSSVSPDPSPTITLNGGSALKLAGISKAMFVNNSFDSIIIVNSNVTDTTLFGKINTLTNVDSISTATISIFSNKSLTTASYSNGNGNTVIAASKIGKIIYSGIGTATIDTLKPNLVAGTYTATEISTNATIPSAVSVAGRFRANIY